MTDIGDIRPADYPAKGQIGATMEKQAVGREEYLPTNRGCTLSKGVL